MVVVVQHKRRKPLFHQRNNRPLGHFPKTTIATLVLSRLCCVVLGSVSGGMHERIDASSSLITLELEPTGLLLLRNGSSGKYYGSEARSGPQSQFSNNDRRRLDENYARNDVDGYEEEDDDDDEEEEIQDLPPGLVFHPYTAGVYSSFFEINHEEEDKDEEAFITGESSRIRRQQQHVTLEGGGRVAEEVVHRRSLSDTQQNTHERQSAANGGEDAINNHQQPRRRRRQRRLTKSQIDDHNRLLREFNSGRHLSRFESLYRQQNGLRTDVFGYIQNTDRAGPSVMERLRNVGNATANTTNTTTTTHTSSNNNNNNNNNNTFIKRLLNPLLTTIERETTPFLPPNTVFRDSYQSAPLSQGLGTHYATVWVGTPTPQRKTLIVDTGSHHTAFPCRGCVNCGEEHHTDKNFDPEASKTFHALKCEECLYGAQCVPLNLRGKEGGWNTTQLFGCVFSQSYTEGSTWQAFQVYDNVFFGGRDVLSAADPTDHRFSVRFMFGCQTLETGLFVTQLADGIMGLSQHDATLPRAMYDQRKISKRIFTMCFRREIVVSKKGISAGVITLGGVNTKLHTSPVLHAVNLSSRGWYTVYVKGIYLRKGGGQSAKNTDPKHLNVRRIMGDMYALNSGKGIILDSGTTDTYLHVSLQKEFNEAWKEITGKAYSNNPMRLSRGDLLKLPTILIQIMAYDDQNFKPPDDTVGLVGPILDPDAPYDILLAVPATHYMEYSPSKGVYTSRFYFTESQGGVIGANSLQGHDVIFDWENGRVGLAESDCVVVDSLNDKVAPKHEANDCIVKEPVLAEQCAETVDVSICAVEGMETTLVGKETWSTIIEFPGLVSGKNCEQTLLQIPLPGPSMNLPEEAHCDRGGLCTVTRACELPCRDIGPDKRPKVVSASDVNNGLVEMKECGDYAWGACLDSCFQSKIRSVLMSDGLCHENKLLREGRSCHVDFCGRSDPCRIPFVVHVILGFLGADISRWNKSAEDCVVDAFTATTNTDEAGKFVDYFEPGDVKIIMTNPWYKEAPRELVPDGLEGTMGIKVVLEVSLYNPKGTTPVLSTLSLKDKNHRQLHECKDSDMFPLATKAHEIHKKLEDENFMASMIAALKNNPSVSVPVNSLFAPTVSVKEFIDGSKVFSSWTIASELSGEEIYDHKIDAYLDHRNTRQVILAYLHNYIVMAFIVVIAAILFCNTEKAPSVRKDRISESGFVSQYRNQVDNAITKRKSSARKRRDKYSKLRMPYHDDSDIEGFSTDGEQSCNSKYAKLTSIITN